MPQQTKLTTKAMESSIDPEKNAPSENPHNDSPESATPLSDEALVSRDGEEEDMQYPKGMSLFMLTLGMMAVVLMVALDNYILGPLHSPKAYFKYKSRG